jgi:hypothetical protein
MKNIVSLFILMVTTSSVCFAGNEVVVKINGKEARDLSLNLYLKPGIYKPAPKTNTKRANLVEIAVTTPTEGLEATDSLDVRVNGYAGSIAYYKTQQRVAAGSVATFAVAEPAKQDYTPNGKQPTLLGRFEVEVVPVKRPQQKGQYKGLISLE